MSDAANDMALNVALNKSECLVSKVYLGYDKITNVCTGKTFDVSWGVGDWASATAFVILAAFCVALFYGIYRMIREDF